MTTIKNNNRSRVEGRRGWSPASSSSSLPELDTKILQITWDGKQEPTTPPCECSSTDVVIINSPNTPLPERKLQNNNRQSRRSGLSVKTQLCTGSRLGALQVTHTHMQKFQFHFEAPILINDKADFQHPIPVRSDTSSAPKKGSKSPLFSRTNAVNTSNSPSSQQTQFPWGYHPPQITTSLYELTFEIHANALSAAEPLDQRENSEWRVCSCNNDWKVR